MSIVTAVAARAPGITFSDRLRTALLRALRTLLQGLAGAFPAAGMGTVVLTTSYWTSFGYAALAALITALISFLQNVADFLPTDPHSQPRRGQT